MAELGFLDMTRSLQHRVAMYPFHGYLQHDSAYAAGFAFAGYELENADKRDESRIKPLYKKFGMWHGISSSLNLVATVGAVVHGWWLAGMMVAPVV